MKKTFSILFVFAMLVAKSQNPHDIVASSTKVKGVCGNKQIIIEITLDTWKYHIRGGRPGVNVWVRPRTQLTWVKIGSFTSAILTKTFSVSNFGTYDIRLADGAISNINASPDPCIQLSDCNMIKTISVLQCKPHEFPPNGN